MTGRWGCTQVAKSAGVPRSVMSRPPEISVSIPSLRREGEVRFSRPPRWLRRSLSDRPDHSVVEEVAQRPSRNLVTRRGKSDTSPGFDSPSRPRKLGRGLDRVISRVPAPPPLLPPARPPPPPPPPPAA